MKKLFGFAALAVLFLFTCAIPVQAQKHSGGGNSNTTHMNSGGHSAAPQNHQQPQNHPQSHPQVQNHQQTQPRGRGQSQSQNHPQGHFMGDNGRHTSDADRRHFDGRHFDRDFHRNHFGREHRFRCERPVFYGGFYRFWYDGFWFNMYDPWYLDWNYGDETYIEYDASCDCYYLYNFRHPGFRIRLGVVF